MIDNLIHPPISELYVKLTLRWQKDLSSDSCIDYPSDPNKGIWFVDAIIKDKHFVIDWHPKKPDQFCLTKIDKDTCFGTGPDFVFFNQEDVLAKIEEIVNNAR